ncbi:hypothetical protein ACFYMW_25410 [Streptomyces sp. NPDC006692]|uniref:hypothetical protein n=1 Tax=unclassified Streptomyces TaxID=2593676 RepID=UPI00341E9C58
MSAGRWFHTSAFGDTPALKRAAATKAAAESSPLPPTTTTAEPVRQGLQEARERETG